MSGVTVDDFISRWKGNFRIEDKNQSVWCEFIENLTEDLKNKNIVEIKVEKTIWGEDDINVILVI